MKRLTILALITVLVILSFSKNEIQVINLENGLKVVTRFNEFELSKKGDIVNVYLTLDRKIHIFQADDDGLELFSLEGSPLNIVATTIKGTMTAPNTYTGDLSIVYEYEEGVQKIITFKNAPEYITVVEVKSTDAVTITLPRVWYQENDRVVKDYFVSFAPKNRIISVSKVSGAKLVSNRLTIDGVGRVTLHMAPYKRIF